MKVKQYLMQAIVIRDMIKRTEDQIAEIRTKMEGVGSTRYDKLNVQSSPVDMMASYMDKLTKVEKREQRLLVNYYETYEKIQRQIDELDRPLYRQILSLRYLDGMSLFEISKTLHYTYEYVRNLHGYALLEFARVNNM